MSVRSGGGGSEPEPCESVSTDATPRRRLEWWHKVVISLLSLTLGLFLVALDPFEGTAVDRLPRADRASVRELMSLVFPCNLPGFRARSVKIDSYGSTVS